MGHAFSNPEDMPFAAVSVWALYHLIRVAQQLPRPERSTSIKLGVTLGLACGIRIGGLVLAAYLVALFGSYWLVRVLGSGGPERLRGTGSGRWRLLSDLFRDGLIVGGIAYVTMVALWPWAFENPILGPPRAFLQFSSFPGEQHVLFRGVVESSFDLPVSYLATYLPIQLPEAVLIGWVAALVVGLAALRGAWPAVRAGALGRSSRLFRPASPIALVALAALFPVIRVTLTGVALSTVPATRSSWCRRSYCWPPGDSTP